VLAQGKCRDVRYWPFADIAIALIEGKADIEIYVHSVRLMDSTAASAIPRQKEEAVKFS
jgi:hypothetical protein